MPKPSLVALLAILLLASSLEAQRRSSSSGADAAARGAPSISLEVGPEANAFVGLWGRVAAPVSLGVEVELGLAQDEVDDRTSTSSTLGAGASAKWYLTPRSSLTPFLYGHLGVTRRSVDTELPSYEEESTGMLVRGAVGLEWFASRAFSVGGNVGARWRSLDVEVESAQGASERDVTLLEAFTSGISLAFHF